MSNTMSRLPFSFAKRHGVFVKSVHDSLALVYRAGIEPQIFAEVNRLVGLKCCYEEVGPEEFDQALAAAYENNSKDAMEMVEGIGDDFDLASLADSVPETEDLLEQEDDAPIIRLINALLTEAVKRNASDIHIETFERRLVVRFRIDGILQEVVQPKRALAPLLVSRIKVMAKLDIAEKRIPQDGRISLRVAGREVDIRVSTLPAHNGERVVLRLLDKQAGRLNLSHLGMSDDSFALMKKVLHRPHGIILVTGPTGSGKTTTLYACLSELNDKKRNILTVEDPIEYNIEGIGQTQVSNKIDMSFARGLRAILRQDPDVVMIGEIRDLETAEIAVQASLTGHLVLSTLHTNSAVGAVTRLYDMGIEPFLLSSSLIGVLAQRLVRLLCVDCKQAHLADASECEILFASAQTIGVQNGGAKKVEVQNSPTIYRAKGCESCDYLGYSGRTGIYELVLVDEAMNNLIHSQASEQSLRDYARTRTIGIREDGCQNVLKGITTLEEVLRVTQEDS